MTIGYSLLSFALIVPYFIQHDFMLDRHNELTDSMRQKTHIVHII